MAEHWYTIGKSGLLVAAIIFKQVCMIALILLCFNMTMAA
jgi:hypothetical protein